MLKDMRREDDSVSRLMDMALQLEGLYRHASTHAAGVVIGDRPLDELIPLYRDPRSDMPVTQFNMKDVEKAGLVKFDFLGLKTLSVLQRAVEHLRDRGVDLDLSTLPLDDPASYEMMSRGDTTGVFQLESTGMRDVLRRLKPDRFEDIIAVVALYRPGPMENIPSYIARKHEEEEVTYLHDLLEPVLKETFGIPIYQEQVQQMARDLAGYTLGGADLLRRAMGKKIKAEMDAQRETFVNGCAEHSKIGKPLAERIFDTMAAFAGYGFNKSHAAAYALVAYQTAYLKANYPVEFLAASMTFDMGNTDRLAGFRRELLQQGIDLLPPDINASEARFTVEEGAVRYALGALKNVGVQAMSELAAERRANGPFKSLGDLAGRLDPQILNKRQMENLVRSGAFDSLMPNRKRLFEGLERVLKLASSAARDRNDAQENLFGDAAESAEAHLDLPDMLDWPEMDRLRYEFDAVGFYLSAHPLDSYAANLKRLKVLRYADLAAQTARGVQPGAARLAGTVTGWRERRSARGNKFAFIQLSDSSGMYEVTAFSEVLSAARDLLEEASGSGAPVLITAEVKREEDAPRLLASAIVPLDSAMDNISTGIRVVVANADAVAALKSVLERDRDGRGEVTVVVPDGAREIEMTLPRKFTNAPATRQAIKSLPGIQHVEEV
jgi:DNA polymerase-3 subunit alpha